MNRRLLQLFAVLIYDTDKKTTSGTGYLTAGQRICINQERAYLMRDDIVENDFPQLEIINEKVAFVLQKIRENGHTNAYQSYVREQLK